MGFACRALRIGLDDTDYFLLLLVPEPAVLPIIYFDCRPSTLLFTAHVRATSQIYTVSFTVHSYLTDGARKASSRAR